MFMFLCLVKLLVLLVLRQPNFNDISGPLHLRCISLWIPHLKPRKQVCAYQTTVYPRIPESSKEFKKCCILNLLIMELCYRYLVFNCIIFWSSLKLFPHIRGYLFIFTVTEIKEYVSVNPLKNCQDDIL